MDDVTKHIKMSKTLRKAKLEKEKKNPEEASVNSFALIFERGGGAFYPDTLYGHTVTCYRLAKPNSKQSCKVVI